MKKPDMKLITFNKGGSIEHTIIVGIEPIVWLSRKKNPNIIILNIEPIENFVAAKKVAEIYNMGSDVKNAINHLTN